MTLRLPMYHLRRQIKQQAVEIRRAQRDAQAASPDAAGAASAIAPRAEFQRRGESMAEWARANGFSRQLVSAVVAGQRKCLRGDSHRIAVLLGIKDGEIA